MSKTWILMGQELAAHWRAYRRAIGAYEPVPFAWTSIGYRIRAAGEALRERLGYEAGEHCNDMLVAAGTITFAGRRNHRRTFYRSVKQGVVPQSCIPDSWAITSAGLTRAKPSRKWYKKPRAIVRGLNVFIRYKGRDIPFKVCVTESGAQRVADRINGRRPQVAKLSRTFRRQDCPECGKSIANNWLSRHMQKYHGDRRQE